MHEEKVGTITHYYNHLGVAAVLLQGDLSVGDTIHVKGHTTDFTQEVESIQIEHEAVDTAGNNDSVGIGIVKNGRIHDAVYKVLED